MLAKPRSPLLCRGLRGRERRYAYCVSQHGPTERREAASGVTMCLPALRLCVLGQVESLWMRATGRRVRNRRRSCEATGGHMQASESVFGCSSLPLLATVSRPTCLPRLQWLRGNSPCKHAPIRWRMFSWVTKPAETVRSPPFFYFIFSLLSKLCFCFALFERWSEAAALCTT